MGAYKKLNKQDAYITTYTAHKQWAVTGSSFNNQGITVNTATGTYLNSMQQNYYPPKDSGVSPSHSFDPSYQTTLDFPEARNLITGSYIISIPRELYGVAIEPKTVRILSGEQSTLYVDVFYWSGNYTLDTVLSGYNLIKDDGEGNLYITQTDLETSTQTNIHVGDVIYNQGMLIITDPDTIDYIETSRLQGIQFKSTVPIYTHNYHCKLRESEFNYTYNPSAVSASIKVTYDNSGDIYNSAAKVNNGVLNDNITGSDFQPYITTVGLYNDAHELVAVGKIGQPVPKSANTDMTFVVKIDI
jgi:hypothetical protein